MQAKIMGRAGVPLEQGRDLTPGVDDWRGQALCAQTDPEAFFPDKGASNGAAKATCRRCPVQAPCLVEGLSIDTMLGRYGVWGGTSEAERRKLLAAGWTPDLVAAYAAVTGGGVPLVAGRDGRSMWRVLPVTAAFEGAVEGAA